MTESKSSRGFNLFTPLVGTTLVIMAILIATTMIQNDIRISRTLTASHEISSQSITAKLIKATAEMQMLENMGQCTYEVVSDYTFDCRAEYDCNQLVENRMLATNPAIMPSVYSKLMNPGGIFDNIIESIQLVLSGSGSNYEVVGSNAKIQQDLFDLILALDDPTDAEDPFELNEDNGRYYIAINSAVFSEGDFVVSFMNRVTKDEIKISIAPYDFRFITDEPLYSLVDSEKSVFLSDFTTASDKKPFLENMLETWFSGNEEYVSGAWFESADMEKRLTVEFYRNAEKFNVTFQTTNSWPDDIFDIECEYLDSGFSCSNI